MIVAVIDVFSLDFLSSISILPKRACRYRNTLSLTVSRRSDTDTHEYVSAGLDKGNSVCGCSRRKLRIPCSPCLIRISENLLISANPFCHSLCCGRQYLQKRSQIRQRAHLHDLAHLLSTLPICGISLYRRLEISSAVSHDSHMTLSLMILPKLKMSLELLAGRTR